MSSRAFFFVPARAEPKHFSTMEGTTTSLVLSNSDRMMNEQSMRGVCVIQLFGRDSLSSWVSAKLDKGTGSIYALFLGDGVAVGDHGA